MPVKKTAIKNYIQTVGRRKSAVARVRLYKSGNSVKINDLEIKKGGLAVNSMPAKEYFRFEGYSPRYDKFLKLLNAEGKYIFTVKVAGGGINSQLDAMIHGMARALDKFDSATYHSMLTANGYLTRDARVRERRKVGMGGKARRKRQSPKR